VNDVATSFTPNLNSHFFAETKKNPEKDHGNYFADILTPTKQSKV